MKLSKIKIESFQNFIWNFYKENKRIFAWRNIEDPYKTVVSEIMLQQTQTDRISKRYPQFIKTFPDFNSLGCAPLRSVLAEWQGLGYNRRGKYLHEIAKKVVGEHDGQLPADPEILVNFPGIGKATAGSICAFAFNMPTVFIETNIRAVFIHIFFQDIEKVSDKELMPLIAATVDKNNPREWYYALMDYGVQLKKKCKNPSRRSKHHVKQSKFEGSDRQIRGMIIKQLTQVPKATLNCFYKTIDRESIRIDKALQGLCSEGIIKKKADLFYIE